MKRGLMILTALGALGMFLLIGKASVDGHFWEEGSVLFALLWGKVTLADLYAGFALFAGWVLFREASVPRALGWVVLLLCLGNAFSLIYVLVALARCGGSAERFWLGDRAGARSSS